MYLAATNDQYLLAPDLPGKNQAASTLHFRELALWVRHCLGLAG
jgi:hypothetical protein